MPVTPIDLKTVGAWAGGVSQRLHVPSHTHVIVDCVDASSVLHGEEHDTDAQTLQVVPAPEQRLHRGHDSVAGMLLVVLNGTLDLVHFLLDVGMVRREISNVCKIVEGGCEAVTRCKPTGRLFYEQNANAEAASRDQLDRKRDSPLLVAIWDMLVDPLNLSETSSQAALT